MTGWHCNGRALSEEELGVRDGEAICDFAGVAFRFTAETVVSRGESLALRGESTTVMALRCADGSDSGPAVCLVDFSRPARLGAHGRDRLDEAAATAATVVRRRLASELFRRARDSIAHDRVP